MCKSYRFFIGPLLALAAILAYFQIPLASSQGVTIVAAWVPDELPMDAPDSDLWKTATAVEVPLSAQTVNKPILPETKVKSITVRALHNDAKLAFLIDWADNTQDDSIVRVQDFRDAVAVQFPLAEGPPFYCMGQEGGGNVNIWHWKADWQADIIARQDMETLYPNMYVDYYPYAESTVDTIADTADYTDPNYLPALAAGNSFASISHASPVEDLVAGSFSSLTAQPEGQNVQGYGVWTDGRWRVIFGRDLTSTEADDITFVPDRIYPIAFAAWDGANEERNGQKSTSQWVTLQFEDRNRPQSSDDQPADLAQAEVAATTTSSSQAWLSTMGTLSIILLVLNGIIIFVVLVILSRFADIAR